MVDTITALKDCIYWVSLETTSITVTKTWDDAEDQDGIRPESVTVELYVNDEPTGTTATLSEENDWTATFTGLATQSYDGLNDDNSVKLKDNVYTVEEAAVTGYTTAITGSAAAGYTVTNSHTPETTSVTVTKAWDDEDDQDGLQPESVTVTLYAGGTEAATATLNEDNGWTYTFTGLAKYSAGTEIEYTVEEAAVTGYTSVITGSAAEGYVITNSHTPEQTTEETATPSPTPTETPTEEPTPTPAETPTGEPTETPTETATPDTDATATPVVVTPVPTGTAPTTGDESNALLWLGLLLLCAGGVAAVTIVRKRKNQ
ncbi:MAG: Cna B-type domain-containing protein [Oscillospiraceae bacterium]|nr:Cna B-type domain-containing protein [Oscillospiraceae bacterium]